MESQIPVPANHLQWQGLFRPLYPDSLRGGPPELPGFMGAVVWIQSAIGYPPVMSSVTVLPSALTMPVVIDPASPYGLPTAITGSPTFNVDELAISSGLYSLCGASAESTARSAPAEIMAVRSNDGNHNMCLAIALELCILVCSEAISAPARLSTSREVRLGLQF